TNTALAAAPPPPAPPTGVGYQDYARWQHDNRERLVRASAEHWRDTVLSLADADPTSAGRAGGSGIGTVERTTRVLDAEVVARAARWATPQGLTEFAVVTAAVAAGMAELTGRTRIGVGVLLDNRTIVEVERTVGPCASSGLRAV
ncbi:condensation domain-containing protein, partial [Actinosynnema sp. NPDC023658]|uniref:condensation domain-containing protein n=1 Tax=Actinosynnema sp. NPDC023658 TaxID=3155465 RepID=UPI0033C192EC